MAELGQNALRCIKVLLYGGTGLLHYVFNYLVLRCLLNLLIKFNIKSEFANLF